MTAAAAVAVAGVGARGRWRAREGAAGVVKDFKVREGGGGWGGGVGVVVADIAGVVIVAGAAVGTVARSG